MWYTMILSWYCTVYNTDERCSYSKWENLAKWKVQNYRIFAYTYIKCQHKNIGKGYKKYILICCNNQWWMPLLSSSASLYFYVKHYTFIAFLKEKMSLKINSFFTVTPFHSIIHSNDYQNNCLAIYPGFYI